MTSGEFGHDAWIGKIDDMPVCVDSWGAGPFVILAGGKSYRVEDSDRFGPCIVRRNGDVAAQQPTERSPFWRAHWLWRRQGRQLADDGVTCVWREPKPTLYRTEKEGRRRMLVVVEKGEPDGKEFCDGKELRFNNVP